MKRGAIGTVLMAIIGFVGIGVAGASASPAPRACGTITWHEAGFTFHDRIYVRRGRVSCATARNVLYDAYASPPPYGGWRCQYHEQQRAYVTCSLHRAEIYGRGT